MDSSTALLCARLLKIIVVLVYRVSPVRSASHPILLYVPVEYLRFDFGVYVVACLLEGCFDGQ